MGGLRPPRECGPHFSLGCAQRKVAAAAVEKKGAFAQSRRRWRLFAQIRGWSWPVRCRLADPYRVRYPPGEQGSAPPHLIVRHFFRGWSLNGPTSLSAAATPPGREIQRGGAAAPPLCVVRGCGGEIETPPRFWKGSQGEVSLRQRHLPLTPRLPSARGETKTARPFGRANAPFKTQRSGFERKTKKRPVRCPGNP